jgi:diaminohydroxyphosphoribosylaminopyrimidine deaminase/5-amino-6-(5-phosphoribosylamino)uracil reductase
MQLISEDILWEIILELKRIISLQQKKPVQFTVQLTADGFTIADSIRKTDKNMQTIYISQDFSGFPDKDSALFTLDENFRVSTCYQGFLDATYAGFFKQYLPFCFSSLIAHKQGRSFSILHLAQSIDGKIATENGHSKWVSNQENLIHSHRMRALSDAILIGSNTLKSDSPKLTVRLVKGPNPVKVIIANTFCNMDILHENGGNIILFTSKSFEPSDGVEIISLPEQSGSILPDSILKELYKRNICSLYIEGGAITASHFLMGHSIDLVQIFISPKIFGSGVSSFCLPPIEKVERSVCFSNPSFIPMGNGMLFEGRLA